MTDAMRRFTGTLGERSALAAMARLWAGDFWGCDDVLAALTVPATVLLYADGDAADWRGCLLGREDGADAELFYIFVEPGFRGQGIGRALFESWRQELRARAIHLEVRPSRTEALKLYESLGFQVVRRRRNYYGDGEDALIMKRDNA